VCCVCAVCVCCVCAVCVFVDLWSFPSPPLLCHSLCVLCMCWRAEKRRLSRTPADPWQAAWKAKVDEFVTLRTARRTLAENRGMVGSTAWASAEAMFSAFFFDPFDPEWSCDTKRKIGTPTCVPPCLVSWC
jgi:hypothetical protein